MMQCNKQSSGFTLLELLVVISIIGILIAMGVAAFSTAQSKGRDAKRRGDMEAIQDAQEQYYAANGDYAWSGELTGEGFIQTLPEDPQNPNTTYDLDFSPPAGEYCACADLEDDSGNSNNSSCSDWTNGDGDWFCVSNLQ